MIALLNSKEAAALLRIHPRTLRLLVLQGKVPALRIGRQLRFSAVTLEQWATDTARANTTTAIGNQ